MTRKKYIYLFLAAILTFTMSCKDDAVKPDYTANKAQLQQLTDSVNQAYTSSAEGHGLGQYPKQARADLKEALDLAAAVNTGNHTQEEVNNAFSNLRRAIAAFNGRAIAEVAADNLVAKWLFAGNALDATVNHHDGVLMTGLIAGGADGGTLPVLTTDRFGQQGNAYEFANGAYIEIPYTITLNPAMISISLWVNPKETYGNNYMISLNRWNGFKFQLQSDNFLFMTLKTDAATFDKDSNPGKMVNGQWHHAVVTAGNGAINFYVDGALVKTESLAGTAAKLAAPVNLVIGQQLPKNSDPANFSSDSFFKGLLDDIRYYNKVLSSAEVMQIYNNEKPD
jgi:hypothetical protein